MKYSILFDTIYRVKHQLEFDIKIEEKTALDGGDPCSSKINSERLLQMRRHLKDTQSILDAAFRSIEEASS